MPFVSRCRPPSRSRKQSAMARDSMRYEAEYASLKSEQKGERWDEAVCQGEEDGQSREAGGERSTKGSSQGEAIFNQLTHHESEEENDKRGQVVSTGARSGPGQQDSLVEVVIDSPSLRTSSSSPKAASTPCESTIMPASPIAKRKQVILENGSDTSSEEEGQLPVTPIKCSAKRLVGWEKHERRKKGKQTPHLNVDGEGDGEVHTSPTSAQGAKKTATVISTPRKRASPKKAKSELQSEDEDDDGKARSSTSSPRKKAVVWTQKEEEVFGAVYIEALLGLQPSLFKQRLEGLWQDEGMPARTSVDINNHLRKWKKVFQVAVGKSVASSSH